MNVGMDLPRFLAVVVLFLRLYPYPGCNGSCHYYLPITWYTSAVKCFVNVMGPAMGMLSAWILYNCHKPKSRVTEVIRHGIFSTIISRNVRDLIPVNINGIHTDGYKIVKNSIGTNFAFNMSRSSYLAVGHYLMVIVAAFLKFR